MSATAVHPGDGVHFAFDFHDWPRSPAVHRAAAWSVAIHVAALAWPLLLASQAATGPARSIEVRLAAPARAVAEERRPETHEAPPPVVPPQKREPPPVLTRSDPAPGPAVSVPAAKPEPPAETAAAAPAAPEQAARDAPAAAGGGAVVEEPPRFDAAYLYNPPPPYPTSARSRAIEGKVLLRVRVSPAGEATQVELAKSSGYSVLDQAAQQAVRGWRFVPAKRGGEAIAGIVLVPIVFRLDDAV